MICTQASCVMIYHYSVMNKKRLQFCIKITVFFGGERWIRTTEGKPDRFTVCCHWPLGNLPKLKLKKWSCRLESNPQPADYKSAALPVELRQHLVMVPRGGIEPPTRGFSVPCSTDWATEAKKMATRNGLEPSTSSVTGWRSNQLNYRAVAIFNFLKYFFGGPSGTRTPDQSVMSRPL